MNEAVKEKQQPRTALDFIKKGVEFKPPVVLLYGTEGIGKTTWATSSENSILIPIEEGWGHLDVNRFPLITNFEQFASAIHALEVEDHDYSNIVIDSVDWLERLVHQRTIELFPQGGISEISDYPYGGGYAKAIGVWEKHVLQPLTRIRNDRGMGIILIAHSEIKPFADPVNEPFDRYQIKLHKSSAAKISEWADCVLFANWEMHTTKTSKGMSEHTRGVGQGKRKLFCEERPGWRAKNRYGLPPELDFEWSIFFNAIKEGMKNGK
jgi:hypothetical protein